LSFFRSGIGSLIDAERGGLEWLSRRAAEVASTHPVFFELGGAVLMAGGFLACHFSNWMLAFVMLGFLVHWKTDALVVKRPIAKAHHGFFIDHSTDLITQTLVVLGLGFSPYFTLCSALLVLSIFLLISSYSYLRFMVMAAAPLFSGGGVVSEFCFVATIWGLFAAVVGPGVIHARLFDRSGLDVCVGAAWLLIFLVFIIKVRRDLAQIDDDRPPCA
jgi:archaetidylinositol phosphate synthase